MQKDWKDVTDDELLNYSGAVTAEVARYDRIMQQKSIVALGSLRDKVVGLMETVYRASENIGEKSDKLLSMYDKISQNQSRQQSLVIALTIVIAVSTAVYTCITWQSVAAMREANDIQRQALELSRQTARTGDPARGSPDKAPSAK